MYKCRLKEEGVHGSLTKEVQCSMFYIKMEGTGYFFFRLSAFRASQTPTVLLPIISTMDTEEEKHKLLAKAKVNKKPPPPSITKGCETGNGQDQHSILGYPYLSKTYCTVGSFQTSSYKKKGSLGLHFLLLSSIVLRTGMVKHE